MVHSLKDLVVPCVLCDYYFQPYTMDRRLRHFLVPIQMLQLFVLIDSQAFVASWNSLIVSAAMMLAKDLLVVVATVIEQLQEEVREYYE